MKTRVGAARFLTSGYARSGVGRDSGIYRTQEDGAVSSLQIQFGRRRPCIA
jgi:hypothetical protein